MAIIYYAQVNTICIIVLVLFLNQGRSVTAKRAEADILYRYLMITAIVMCAMDMVAGICRGKFFPGAKVIIEISNLMYDESLTVIGYLWLMYVLVIIRKKSFYRGKNLLLISLPLLLFTIVAILNPVTHFIFAINENNLYTRGKGIVFHWCITWGYLLFSLLMVLWSLHGEKNRQKRQDAIPLLWFLLAPTIGSAIQMLCYGVSSTQVGVVISVVMVGLSSQNNQMLTDSLTGLNNRRGFEHYIDDYLSHTQGIPLMLMMIDVNGFKKVNDTYGHDEGDDALRTTASILRDSCRTMPGRPFLCRYGGDEFIIALSSIEGYAGTGMAHAIHASFASQKKQPYPLSVSIGTAISACMTVKDVENLLHQADEDMYRNKTVKR